MARPYGQNAFGRPYLRAPPLSSSRVAAARHTRDAIAARRSPDSRYALAKLPASPMAATAATGAVSQRKRPTLLRSVRTPNRRRSPSLRVPPIARLGRRRAFTTQWAPEELFKRLNA